MRWLLGIALVASIVASIPLLYGHPHPEYPHPTPDPEGVAWDQCNAAGFPTKWDKYIRKAVIKHWPLELQPYHCYWRAQLAKESSLDTRHCEQENSSRAKCLAQLLPGTAKEVEEETGLQHTRTSAVAAIMGGAYFMNKQFNFWREPRDWKPCRIELGQAGYVSGAGHIEKAQRLARKDGKAARCFDEIAPYLDQVITPSNAADVIEYRATIRRYYREMTDVRLR